MILTLNLCSLCKNQTNTINCKRDESWKRLVIETFLIKKSINCQEYFKEFYLCLICAYKIEQINYFEHVIKKPLPLRKKRFDTCCFCKKDTHKLVFFSENPNQLKENWRRYSRSFNINFSAERLRVCLQCVFLLHEWNTLRKTLCNEISQISEDQIQLLNVVRNHSDSKTFFQGFQSLHKTKHCKSDDDFKMFFCVPYVRLLSSDIQNCNRKLYEIKMGIRGNWNDEVIETAQIIEETKHGLRIRKSLKRRIICGTPYSSNSEVEEFNPIQDRASTPQPNKKRRVSLMNGKSGSEVDSSFSLSPDSIGQDTGISSVDEQTHSVKSINCANLNEIVEQNNLVSETNRTKTPTIDLSCNINSNKPYTCNICDKLFPYLHELKAHIFWHLNPVNAVVNVRRISKFESSHTEKRLSNELCSPGTISIVSKYLGHSRSRELNEELEESRIPSPVEDLNESIEGQAIETVVQIEEMDVISQTQSSTGDTYQSANEYLESSLIEEPPNDPIEENNTSKEIETETNCTNVLNQSFEYAFETDLNDTGVVEVIIGETGEHDTSTIILNSATSNCKDKDEFEPKRLQEIKELMAVLQGKSDDDRDSPKKRKL